MRYVEKLSELEAMPSGPASASLPSGERQQNAYRKLEQEVGT